MKIKLIAAVLVLVAPFAVYADVDYSFAEFDYASLSIDDADEDATGFTLRGSAALNDTWYGVLNYSDLSMDLGAADMDLTQLNLGIGGHMELAAKVDLLGELTYEKAEADVGATSVSDNGYGIKVGLRGMMSDALELNGHVRRVDMDEAENMIGLGAAWEFTDSWSLTFGYEMGDDADMLNLGVRYGF